jgi:hypothetical protein
MCASNASKSATTNANILSAQNLASRSVIESHVKKHVIKRLSAVICALVSAENHVQRFAENPSASFMTNQPLKCSLASRQNRIQGSFCFKTVDMQYKSEV